jgi:sugar (pentulose or hexulose) kinase
MTEPTWLLTPTISFVAKSVPLKQLHCTKKCLRHSKWLEGSTVTSPIWIGVDIGTQSIRAIAIDDSGITLGMHSVPLASFHDGVLHEQNAGDWLAGAITCMSTVTSQLADPQSIGAISVSATSGTIVVVDEDGQPVTPGIMYDDSRGAEFAATANAADPELWGRLGYRAQGSWSLCEMAWLQREGFLTTGRTVLNQPDIVTWALAGQPVASDSSHALKAGLDLDSLAWPETVFAALDIPLNALPAIVESGSIIGQVTAAASLLTGLPTGCSIVAGMTDGCAAQIATGALAPGDWSSVLGTTLVLKGASSQRLHDETGSVYAHRAPFGGGWWPGGASSTGASAILNWLPNIDPGDLVFTPAELRDAPVVYPLAGHGERFPFVASEAHSFALNGEFPSLSTHGVPSTFASVAKGLAFVERLCFDLLQMTGYNISGRLFFSGGGANNNLWSQLRSDVLGVPVFLPAVKEGAIGMAVLAAAALESLLNADSPSDNPLADTSARILGESKIVHPEETNTTWLLEQYSALVTELHNRGWVSRSLFTYAKERATR